MKVFVFGALGLLLFCFFFAWMVTHVHYHITPRHLKVTLFRIPLRRVRISNIASVSKRRAGGLAENWWSTLRPNHRSLVIRRKRGLIKNVVITPRNRYVFKTELERAVQRANAPEQEPAPEAVPVFID
jgi:hypothetical protein